MESVNFSSNWNNKLSCQCFTTFRLHSRKYKPGQTYEIKLKGKRLKLAKCVSIKTVTLSQVNEWVAMLDTGYPLAEFTKTVQTMYKNIVQDFDSQRFDLILFITL